MFALQIPAKRLTQPRSAAVLNRRHPLGAALDYVFLGSDLSGTTVGKVVVATPPSSAYVKASPQGLAIENQTFNAGAGATIPAWTTYPYTVMGYGWALATGGTLFEAIGSGTYLALQNLDANNWSLFLRHNFGTYRLVSVNTGAGANSGSLACLIGVVYSATDYRIFANGIQVNGTLDCGSPPSYTGISAPCSSSKAGVLLSGVGFGRSISDADALRITANPRSIWEIFAPETSRIWIGASAGGALAASGGDVASGSAALQAAVALAGVGVTVAGGTAAAGVAIPLSAAGISLAGGSAAPVATITISASGLAQAAGAAGLSAAVLLAGAGAAQAAGNASLAAMLAAQAAGAAQAGGSATLSGGATGAISAAGSDVAGGSAALRATVNISAAGFVQAMGNGALWVSVRLAASGQSVAGGAAQLTLLGAQSLVADARYIARQPRREHVAERRRRIYEARA